MGDNMKAEELKIIGAYVKSHLPEWILETRSESEDPANRISLIERMVRVEEGLKHQGDLLEKLIQQQDRRFGQMFAFLTTIFIVLGTLMSVYQFLA